ncbi:MAG TPA: aldehyde dehydrogenase family protein [Candidatus Methylomirabilis sp.]|nr:aldehyde dehydrogenase family protein [Candidatus Methylomirabilis sp.]
MARSTAKQQPSRKSRSTAVASRPKAKSAKATAQRKAGPPREATFRLTYATMFDPPSHLHDQFEKALAHVRVSLGQEYPMWIGGKERSAVERFEDRSPIHTDWILGTFAKGTAQDAADAVTAAHAAFPTWSRARWQERVRLLRKVVALIEKRVYEMSAALALEVGKNRMEALGDVQEAADLIAYYCESMERNGGFIRPMGRDPLKGYTATNVSVLRPHGVWVVVSPFNFPVALSGGPLGAALVAGNTVVLKPATDTPWAGGALLSRCFIDAGLPEGVFNFVTGPGGTLGEALVSNPQVDGITFTGSYDVGMRIYRTFAGGRHPRPCIAEMGGKNPAIVSRRADLDRAAMGIFRAAFGLQGQKCSACSRIFVEKPVKDALVHKLLDLTSKITVGDPTQREHWMGPVINRKAYEDFGSYAEELGRAGTILTGGKHLTEGDLARGYFCAPTLVDGVLPNHRLWRHEMFLPICMLAAVDSLEEAMQRANDVDYGLTAGFYGSKKEADWFFDNIQAGVAYANRPQGATTGAWPGYQPFGGWKASGSSGKNGGGLYYLQLYMHEQSRTLIE